MIISFDIKKGHELRVAEQLDFICFVSESINHVKVNASKLEIDMDKWPDQEMLQKIEQALRVAETFKLVPSRIIRTTSKRKQSTGKMIPVSTHGGLMLKDDETKYKQALDGYLQKMFSSNGACIREYPTFLHEDIMNKCQYNHNFPQHTMRVAAIPHNNEIMGNYRADIVADKDTASYFRMQPFYLRPCICYHAYEEFSNYDSQSLIKKITAGGKCFRNELVGKRGETRLLEFHMREFVFVGTKTEVLNIRTEMMDLIWDLFLKLGLTGSIVSANDPFFTQNENNKSVYQRAAELKYELIVSGKGDEDGYSIASFNYCGSAVCDAFGLNANDVQHHSGCVAIGIDRWIQALRSTHGPDVYNWPVEFRDILEEERR
ncbi:aminoacyl--tRNA ligase-related protein [Paenibacillus kobensis]|uniref:aminoacyl--tRNA ligase-related protein n=1 Tax=Paenibacillus kobensis TaxID=59841 RepID=UPI000FDC0FDA|nr:aminoacyl--tRNA ligase-related protein [Paenibacillus kobensis]